LRVWDPSIRTTKLWDDPNIPCNKTIGDCEGKPLYFASTDNRPMKCALYTQAMYAYQRALLNEWIDASTEVPDYIGSPVEMTVYMRKWLSHKQNAATLNNLADMLRHDNQDLQDDSE
jgi:hypothetical protein